MQFIPTTATAVEKLRRQAKTLRKSTGTSLAVAQDTIAQQHGYAHWKHVTVCAQQTTRERPRKPLPEHLADYLDRAAARDPASAETQKAFGHGFVFAMDVKDAESLTLEPEYIEFEDGWYIAARQLWPALIQELEEESGGTFLERLAPSDLLRTALDDVSNYRLFRYAGLNAPASLEEAYQRTQALSFFPPTHMWINGRFVDVFDLPELRIDGKVVLSSSKETHSVLSKQGRTRMEKFGHLLSEEERTLFASMNIKEQEAWLFELEKRTPLGRSRYRPVSTSARVSWQNASKA